VLRWEHLHVDVTDATTEDHVLERASEALAAAVGAADGRPVAARITLRGRTALHGKLFGEELSLRTKLHAEGLRFGDEGLWIEKVRLETQPPWSKQDLDARGDAVADLSAALEGASDDEGLLAELKKELGDLLSKVDPAVRGAEEPMLSAAREGRFEDLIRDVA